MIREGKMQKMLPILAERTKDRVYYDAYENVVGHEPLMSVPSKELKTRIKRALGMGDRMPFPRCSGRDYVVAERLDRHELGHSLADIRAGKGFHTVQRHVCSRCRCTCTAGEGTRGWWYWPPDSGLPEVGHYGVGPCFLHGPSYSTRMGGMQVKQYQNRILLEIQAMEQKGLAPTGTGGYLVDLERETALAEKRQSTRTVLSATYKIANETITQLRATRGNKDTEEEYLANVCGMFGLSVTDLDDDDREKLLEYAMQRPLTEYVNRRLRPMSDATSIEIERKLLKEVGIAAKLAFDTHEEQFMHKDDVTIIVGRFMQAAERCFRARAGESNWDKFTGDLRDILQGFSNRSIETTGTEL
jgi:hypothetical protein